MLINTASTGFPHPSAPRWMAAAMTGANFGYEASSFFDDKGGPPRVGQFLLGFRPGPLSGGTYAERVEVLTRHDMARLVLVGNHVIAEERLLDEPGHRLRHVSQGPDGAIYVIEDMPRTRILKLTAPPTFSDLAQIPSPWSRNKSVVESSA